MINYNHRTYTKWIEISKNHYQLLVDPEYIMMIKEDFILFREIKTNYERIIPL